VIKKPRFYDEIEHSADNSNYFCLECNSIFMEYNYIFILLFYYIIIYYYIININNILLGHVTKKSKLILSPPSNYVLDKDTVITSVTSMYEFNSNHIINSNH